MSDRICPKNKVAFATLDEAKHACSRLHVKNYREGRKLKAETGIRPKRVKVVPYICGYCGQWHVGRGPKGKDAEWSTRPLSVTRILPEAGKTL